MSGWHNESGIAEALELALIKGGSASAEAHSDVADLVELARTLEEAASHVRPRYEFRARSRQRLAMHMMGSARQQHALRPSVAERARVWTGRLAAGLGALTLAGAAAASASASALPGDALYPVKQVTEAATLQLAPTDSVRQDILIHRADTRLDETARLLRQGRDTDAATTAAQYEQTLAALPTGGSSQSIEPEMVTNQARLTELLHTAPGPARAGLEGALSATERHTNAAAQKDAVKPAAIATPASDEPLRPTKIADAEPERMRPSVSAAGNGHGHGNIAANDAPASSDSMDLPNQAGRTRVVEPDVATAEHSDAPPGANIGDSHPASQLDAKPETLGSSMAPRANRQSATAPPPRSAPERQRD